MCHADEASKFGNNPHSKLALTHGGKGVTCEGCHGPGQAHIDGGGDVTKIFSFKKATPKEASDKCLTCHATSHVNFERSPHAKAGVSCINCHSVHAGDTENVLLKAPQPQLCYECHAEIKPAFSQPFHHKVNEGLVKCSDCHDTHGTFGNNQVKSTADQNDVCTKCHEETRGPFVYSHPVVRAEGCIACHTPHGSQNARLLNMPNIQQLCYQCHSVVAADTIHGQLNMNNANSCIDCHTQVHGSNIDGALRK
jgi:DmsE family decaheme c-type cytochrome